MADFEKKWFLELLEELSSLTDWMFEHQMLEKKTDGSSYIYFVPSSGMDADFEIIFNHDEYSDECLRPELIRFTTYEGIQCISNSELDNQNLTKFLDELKRTVEKECSKRIVAILKEMRKKVYGDVEGNQDCYTFVEQRFEVYFEYFNNRGKQLVMFFKDGMDIHKIIGVNSFGCLKEKYINCTQRYMDVYEEIKEDLNHVVLPWTGKTSPVNFE